MDKDSKLKLASLNSQKQFPGRGNAMLLVTLAHGIYNIHSEARVVTSKIFIDFVGFRSLLLCSKTPESIFSIYARRLGKNVNLFF